MQIMQGQDRSCQSRVGHGSASPSPCGCDPCNGDLLLELWVLVPLLPVLRGLRVLLAALCYLWGSSSPWAPSAAPGLYQQPLGSISSAPGTDHWARARPRSQPWLQIQGVPGEGRGPLRGSCSKEEMPGQD